MTGYDVLLRVITCNYAIRRKNNFCNEFLRISQNLICCARVLVMTGNNALLRVIICYYVIQRKNNLFTEFFNFSQFNLLRARSRYDRL